MKRIVLGISVVLVAFISGFLLKSFSTPSLATASIEDALKNQWGIIGQTIHIEPIGDQVVVFSKKGTGNSYTLRSDFVRGSLLGWKWVWGGGFGGLTGQYIEQVSGINSPLIWGELQNNKIQKVKVSNESRGNYYEAKIVTNLDTRVWFVFPSHNDKVLNIEGTSEKGEVIDSQEIDLIKDLHPDIMFGEKR
jgi:hypothetical protein